MKNGINATATVRFERVCVDSYFLTGPNSDNPYDILTMKNLEKLGKIDNVEINKWQARIVGRAAN